MARASLNNPDFMDALPAIIAWLIVAGVPIFAGIESRRLAPAWISWIVGMCSLAVTITFSEVLYRLLRLLFLRNEKRTVGETGLANVISRVLIDGRLHLSAVARDLDIADPSEIELEAIRLLRSCLPPGSDRFDPRLVQANWKELARLMSLLQESSPAHHLGVE